MPIIQHLIADQFGSHIGKYSERLKITQGGKTLQQAPLLHLETVAVLSKGVSISADALAACCERGIPVHFLDSRGTPYAAIYAAGLTGTVLTRREQLRAYDDQRGLHLGLAFVEGKLRNQAVTLRYLTKNRKEEEVVTALQQAADRVLDQLAGVEQLRAAATPATTIAMARDRLMGMEGNGARAYWQAVRPLLPASYGWQERIGRGATDPINSLLNYGYGILYGQTERALILAGLDPFAGFVHADRPGKPSLVLDLVEEFRQVVVDRVVFGLANRHFTVEQDAQGRMSEATRHTFADHIRDHLDSDARYEGKRYPLRQIIQLQARLIGRFVRGDVAAYTPFKAVW